MDARRHRQAKTKTKKDRQIAAAPEPPRPHIIITLYYYNPLPSPRRGGRSQRAAGRPRGGPQNAGLNKTMAKGYEPQGGASQGSRRGEYEWTRRERDALPQDMLSLCRSEGAPCSWAALRPRTHESLRSPGCLRQVKFPLCGREVSIFSVL